MSIKLNMSRLDRKGGEYGIGDDHGNIVDLYSQSMMQALRMREEEYDFMSEEASDEELTMVVKGVDKGSTFSDKKLCVAVVRKYVALYDAIQNGLLEIKRDVKY